MTRKMNPPIKGHELINEGITFPRFNPDTEMWDGFWGGCRCGAKPPEFPNMSANAMKRWHRQHKAEIRALEERHA